LQQQFFAVLVKQASAALYLILLPAIQTDIHKFIEQQKHDKKHIEVLLQIIIKHAWHRKIS